MTRKITRRAVAYVVVAGAVAVKTVTAGTSITFAIEDFAFIPVQLSVKAGTKVIFVNHDEAPHSVVGLKSEFRSPTLNNGQSFAITFDKPGEIDYFCGQHGNMRGKVTVAP
ncbi:cupredoxin domain-containing protein [Methylocystis sp.]|uniref:cupredoxin domain-containing protein n=1 Tax=Methylocystis sp. TaxID=1911079 RepID=UPI0025DE2781|nr:cupredoxin domain-containing protein [Methylocystis sp.]